MTRKFSNYHKLEKYFKVLTLGEDMRGWRKDRGEERIQRKRSEIPEIELRINFRTSDIRFLF